jgi:hypothetical protein
MTIEDTEVVEVRAFLYDYENNLIDLSTKTGLTYNWKWKDKTNSGFVSINNILDENGKATYLTQLQLNDGSIDLSQNFHILELKIEGWGDYDLYGYLPIPIRTDAKYTHITGATSILYDTSGALVDYYKNPYILHGAEDENIHWNLCGEDIANKTIIEHTKVLYIEANKIDGQNQYIDTGIIPNQDTRIVLEVEQTETYNDVPIFGARTKYGSNAFSMWWRNKNGVQIDYGSDVINVATETITGKLLIDKNKNITYINNEKIYESPESTFTPNCPLYLFALNQNNSVYNPAEGFTNTKLYSCQIY